jgi:Tfp pilus assembly protein PilF
LELSGYLKDKPLTNILREISESKITGWLSVVTEKLDIGNVYFSDGMIIYSNIANQQDRLGDDLVRRGILTENQLKRAIRIQEEMPDRLLGSIIHDLNLIPEDVLRDVLAERIKQSVTTLLAWDSGYYNFAYDRTPEEKYLPVSIDTMELVEIQEEKQSELEDIAEKIPDRNMVFQPITEIFFDLDTSQFSPEKQEVIPLIDGERTVNQIIADSSASDTDVLSLLAKLLDLGAIKIAEVSTEEEDNLAKIQSELENLKTLVAENNFEEAQKACRNILYLDPGNTKAHFYSGVLFFKLNNFEAAKEEFKKVMMMDSDNLEAMINYNLTLEKTASYDEVVNGWYKAIEIAGDNDIRPLINLGYFLYNNGNYSLAKSKFEQANEMDRDHPIPYFYLGLIFAREENDSDSMVNFDQAREIDHSNITYSNNSAQMLERRGMTGKAKMVYNEILEERPDYIYARINLADWYFSQGKMEDAEEEFKKVLERDPKNSFSLFKLGCIYYQKSDIQKAKDYWEKSLDLAPENANLRKLLKAI